MQKFNVPSEFHNLIIRSEISADEIYELPFIKEAITQEDKNKALADFLTEGKAYSKTMPDKYAKALFDENLIYSELWQLSFRQGISPEKYIKRMLGEEDVSSYEQNNHDTLEVRYNKEIQKVNEQLKANAKNPIETLMAETMINLKELSFEPGNRIEMEKCMARFVALKAIQNHAGIKKGESLEDEPERLVSLSKLLVNLDKFSNYVFENEAFRYLAKTYKTEDLSELSRGTDTENMYKFCDDLKDLQKEDSVHKDRITCMDKIVKYSEFVMRNENFFPDKFTLSDKLINSHPNPLKLSIGRSALVTLTLAKMIENGYDVADVLDPYKFTEEKKEFGNRVFEMVKHEENRGEVIKTFLNGYKKTIDYTNNEFSKMKSLNPQDIVKLDNPSFFALGHILKDFTQELGRMKGNVPFSPNNEQKLKDLDNEGEIVNKYIDAASKATEKLILMNSAKDFNNQFVTYNNDFVKLAYLNKSFMKTKQIAEKLHTKFSIAAGVENIEKPNDPSTAVGMVNNALMIAVDYAKKCKNPVKNAFETDANVRDKIGEDVFTGKFSENLQIKVNESNEHVISTKYYDQFEKSISMVK